MSSKIFTVGVQYKFVFTCRHFNFVVIEGMAGMKIKKEKQIAAFKNNYFLFIINKYFLQSAFENTFLFDNFSAFVCQSLLKTIA